MNSAQRMFEIIDSVPEIREAENPIELENPKGKIELKNVSFGYEVNRPVLKELDLEIKAGSMLGIVGRSGAGKTTLVNLISRMYDPQEGEILIDGKNIKDLSFRSLRRNVAMVSQETYIFMGTEEGIEKFYEKSESAQYCNVLYPDVVRMLTAINGEFPTIVFLDNGTVVNVYGLRNMKENEIKAFMAL